mgnify:CR=1 FL=1
MPPAKTYTYNAQEELDTRIRDYTATRTPTENEHNKNSANGHQEHGSCGSTYNPDTGQERGPKLTHAKETACARPAFSVIT